MAGPGATEYVMIDGFFIDCSLNESHSFESDVTEYPVESGSNIVDNIRPLPIVVEMECLVTDTPIGPIITKRPLESPVQSAYDLLMRIRDRREPVTIQTSLRTYENMALKGLSIPRSSGGASALHFTATFHQIQIVENLRTIRVSIPIATGHKNITKTPEPVSDVGDMRRVIIDRQNLMWWDPDFSTWRFHCSYEEAESVHEETGFTTVTNLSKWHLYRGAVQRVDVNALRTSRIAGAVDQEEAHDDPFDMLRFNPPHPIRQQLIVTLSQCVLHGFTIKKSIPADTTSTKSVLKNRTL